MPRTAREKSSVGMYAVLLMSADKERSLFIDDSDYEEFIDRIDNCLGDNAIAFSLVCGAACMIVKESGAGISMDIKSLTTGYARYYSTKYNKNGGVFERRFRSTPIETPEDMASQLACVHELCSIINDEGYTGRYDGDELSVNETALTLMGGTELYDKAMENQTELTAFFSIADRKHKSVKNKKNISGAVKPDKKPVEEKQDKKPAEENQEIVKPKKKKKDMPTWLL